MSFAGKGWKTYITCSSLTLSLNAFGILYVRNVTYRELSELGGNPYLDGTELQREVLY